MLLQYHQGQVTVERLTAQLRALGISSRTYSASVGKVKRTVQILFPRRSSLNRTEVSGG